jgi:hypothetical protein
MLSEPLGFNPPTDDDWIRKCIQVLTGETMHPGPAGHKKGYVFTWILDHISDAAGQLRPRNALLLFAEAAKLQDEPMPTGALLDPRRFMQALRGEPGKPGEVSQRSVDDLRDEYKEEWSVAGEWLPDKFKTFERIWPVSEESLAEFLADKLRMDPVDAKEKIERMVEGGLLERRVSKSRATQLQIPDIYLFGLGLTRKG